MWTAGPSFYGVRLGSGVSVTGSDGRGRVGAAVVRVGAGVGDVVAAGLGVGASLGAAVRGAGVKDVERDALGNADGDGLAEGTASG